MNGERKIFPLLSLASLFYPCFPAAYGQYVIPAAFPVHGDSGQNSSYCRW